MVPLATEENGSPVTKLKTIIEVGHENKQGWHGDNNLVMLMEVSTPISTSRIAFTFPFHMKVFITKMKPPAG